MRSLVRYKVYGKKLQKICPAKRPPRMLRRLPRAVQQRLLRQRAAAHRLLHLIAAHRQRPPLQRSRVTRSR